jgi:beta-galactosidase
VNGKVIAEKTVPAGSITAVFMVPYTPGKLIARCYEGDQEIASQTIATAGKPAALRLKADRNLISAGENDLAYVGVEIVDDSGNIVPSAADLLVRYHISGNGSIAGTLF